MSQIIIDKIKECGLVFVRRHFVDKGLELYEATHKVNNTAIGQYLLLPMKIDEFNRFADDSEYSKFEESVLSPFFYRLKGDWGWNLYLCIVLAEEDMKRVPVQLMARIERNKKYAKKLIVDWSELSERLPAAKIPKGMTGKIADDPYEDWLKILTPINLEFVLDDYQEAKWKAHLNKTLVPRPVQHTTNLPESNINLIKSIRSIHFGHKFRPHLLTDAPSLDFGRMNLIYGPNGMGKTSVLEAIELSMTGSVQRNLLSSADDDEDWDGEVHFADGETFRGIPTGIDKKEREIAYYKHKVAPRARSQINRLFHQYNYFSSEAVHQFCFNVDSRSNYRSDIARMIYGEQLERMEKLWNQYRSIFFKEGERLTKRIGEIKGAILSTKNEDLQATKIMSQRASSGIRNMTKWMSVIKYVYPTIDDNASWQEIENWLQSLTPHLNHFEIVSRRLVNQGLEDIDNEKNLIQMIDSVNSNLLALKNNKVLMSQSLKELPNYTQTEKQLIEDKQSQTRNIGIVERLEGIALYIKENHFIYDQAELRKRRKEIHNHKHQISEKLNVLENVVAQYRPLVQKNTSIQDLESAQTDLRKQHEYYNEAKLQFENAASALFSHEQKADQMRTLASELKSAGLRFLTIREHESHCPLCSHDHKDHMLIVSAIERGLTADDATLTNLLNDKESKRSIMDNHNNIINSLTQQIQVYNEYINAYNDLFSKQTQTGVSIDGPFSPDYLHRYIEQLSLHWNNVKSETNRLESEIISLDSKGFTLKQISDLESLLRDQFLAFMQVEMTNNIPSEEFILIIQAEMKRLQNLNERIQARILDSERAINETAIQQNDLLKQLSEIEKSIMDSEELLLEFEKVQATLKELREMNIFMNDMESWKEWRSFLSQLIQEADSLRKVLEPAVLVEHNNNKIAQLNKEISELESMNVRCDQTLQTLSNLKSLADYSEQFIRSNFKAISRLFVALHAPNEFASLELSADNQIVAVRKGNMQRCAVHQMSTGQRTAVVLALFFVMHLMMETAPRFLMLDEPVANMDELNVLGLLDFLRQLSVSQGTQIFFTTANPQVATLFRRKFSFFKDDFRAYYFQRYLEGPLSIQVQQFKPYFENSLSVKWASQEDQAVSRDND